MRASRVEWSSQALLMWQERRCGTACRDGLGLMTLLLSVSEDLEVSASSQLQAGRRWSVETDESSMDTPPHSGIHSPSESDAYSDSCTESFSDLSTMHSCAPPFSRSYGYSTSDSTTDVSREFSFPRSISSTSFAEEVHRPHWATNCTLPVLIAPVSPAEDKPKNFATIEKVTSRHSSLVVNER